MDETTDTGFDQVAAIILCPSAFDGVPGRKPAVPNSYLEANKLLKEGSNLADAVPKSASLIHELFHALRGDMFQSGKAEKCRFPFYNDLTLSHTAKANRQEKNVPTRPANPHLHNI